MYASGRGKMDHNEAVRQCESLFTREAQHAHDTAVELEVLVSVLPKEKSREIAQLQVKASHRQAKEFRDLAEKVKEK
jgi:hypothetical protein